MVSREWSGSNRASMAGIERAPQLAQRVGRAGGRARGIGELAVPTGEGLDIGCDWRLGGAEGEGEFESRLTRSARAGMLAAPGFERFERIADELRPGH